MALNLFRETFDNRHHSVATETNVPFRSTEELEAYLQEHGIPVEKFGTGDAKTIKHLFTEISSGRCTLVKENGELKRKVATANIDVHFLKDDGSTLYLKKNRQVPNDGRRRSRDNIGWSVMKKLKQGEDPREAAVKGMLEELGIKIKATDLEQTKIVQRTTKSPSYPGLLSEYTSTYFSIFLLPDEYRPEGYMVEQGNMRTHFNWVRVGRF